MKKLLVLLLPFFLSGCVVLDWFKKPEPPIPPTISGKPVVIDRSVLQTCDVLDEPVELSAAEFIYLSSQYGVCAGKQKAGVKVIKDLANIKDVE